MNKIILLLGAFILFFGTIAALEIQSPSRIPSYAPFTFLATLPATNNFTQASILFDGIAVAAVYPSGACTIQPDWVPFLIHCATFDADPQSNEGLTVVVTHTGFAKGTHTIGVVAQGSQAETQSTELLVFDALDEKEIQDVNTQIISINEKVNTLETDSQKAKEDIYGAQNQLNNFQTTAQNAMEEVKGKLSAEQEKNKTNTGFQIPFLSGNNSTGIGFAGGVSAPILGMGVLALIAILVFYFTRVRKQSGFSMNAKSNTPFFEGSMDSLFKGLPTHKNEPAETQPRKWSSEVEGELRKDIEENPPEREATSLSGGKIHFSEIIKKERE